MNKFFSSIIIVVVFIATFCLSTRANSQDFQITGYNQYDGIYPTFSSIRYRLENFNSGTKIDTVVITLKYQLKNGTETTISTPQKQWHNYLQGNIYITQLMLDTVYSYKLIAVINSKDTVLYNGGEFGTGSAKEPFVQMINIPVPLYKNSIIATGQVQTFGLPTDVHFEYAVNNKFTHILPVHHMDPNDYFGLDIYGISGIGYFKDSVSGLDSGTIYPFRCYAVNALGFTYSHEMYSLYTTGNAALGMNNKKENPFTIYPNPTTDYININSVTTGHFSLIDPTGKVILEKDLHDGEEFIKFPEDLPNGFYFWNIVSGENSSSGKIIIKK